MGHVFSVRALRGFILVLIFIFIPIALTNLVSVAKHLWVFYLFFLLIILLRFVIIVDSILVVRKQNPVNLKWYNKSYIYVLLLICGVILTLCQFSFREKIYGYGNYHVPSISMAPTIQPGDFILANTRAFDRGSPKIGDIVIVIPPGTSHIEYIKRVMGLPGDTVAIRDGIVTVNDSSVHFSDIPSNERRMPSSITFGPVIVPDNEYFLLGDNRDHSIDSRTFGFVSKSNLIGQVTYVWFSSNPNRIGERL